MKLTRPQREALARVYQRTTLCISPAGAVVPLEQRPESSPLSYRQFRRLVQPGIGDPVALVPWCGMWLGIEPDGYTHS